VSAYAAQARVVLSAVRSNADLRRVQVALVGFYAAEYGVWIAMLVYAYGHGGATAAGLVALAQLVPAALLGPWAGGLGDRHPRALVLAGGYVVQAAAMGATAAALLSGAPPGVAYVFAAIAATAVTVTRPTQAALTPSLARSPDELTAANVVAGWTESLSVLAAPAATGVLLAVSGPGTVFAFMAAAALGSAVLVAPVALRERGRPPRAAGDADGGGVRAAIALVAREPAARLLVGLLAAQYIAIGALDVLYVVLAIDALDLGESWAGYLNAAFGAGGAIGSAVTVALIGRRRLMPAVMAGIAGWSAAMALLGLWQTAALALALLAAAGVSRTVLDVAGRTLLQRAAAPEVLARVFGLLEGLSMAGLAAGSLLAPLLVGLGGPAAALLGLAAVLPALAALSLRGLLGIDQRAQVPAVELALLRATPMFAALGGPELEALARALEPLEAAPGAVVVAQGEPGDRFYLVADGELAVAVDGATVNTMRRGDGFGEIALLREVPRTATVTAVAPSRLYALHKGAFLAAMTGVAEVERVADARLAHAAPNVSV
jgi:MFS family permease